MNTRNFTPSRQLSSVVALLAAIGAVTPARSGDLPEGSSFFDQFDTLDRQRWVFSDGWANGDWQNCTWSKESARIEGGELQLLFQKRPTTNRDYSCAEIQSKHVYGHGTYEARFRTESGSGLNAAFFTYIGPQSDKPHDEIDVEVLTRDTSKVSLNTYVGAKPNNGKRVALPKKADDGFITYAFTWTEESLDWFVNGKKVHSAEPGSPMPENPQKIFASFWGSDVFPDWMGPFEAPTRDLTMTVDWIAFTALGESCQFPESLLCSDG